MKVLMNAVSAKMGGALAYLRNFLAAYAALGLDEELTVFVHSRFAGELRALAPNVIIETSSAAEGGVLSRLRFDQWVLRRRVSRGGYDCIFSTANFGVLMPPAPQVTSMRNPVYFCRDYYRHVADVEGRLAVARVSARRRMAELSCVSSAVVVTPTAAMRDMLLAWNAVGVAKCAVINHGFDRESFLSMKAPAAPSVETALTRRAGETILFYPSLYGKHKNFDTLMRGLAALVARGHNARLILTCRIDPAADAYQKRTWRIVEDLGLTERITMLGPVSYSMMPRVYGACDVVVWPTFAESFGHPLLEAMACGRPIVSSSIPVNHEMARGAAVYFDTYDEADFADKVEEALRPETAGRLVDEGQRRVGDFSWKRHVEEFVEVWRRIAGKSHG